MAFIVLLIVCLAFDGVIALGLQWSISEMSGHHVPYFPLLVCMFLLGVSRAISQAVRKALD